MTLSHPFLTAGLLAAAFALPAGAAADAWRIDRLEPPFWWTGMQHGTVQLMVHGRGIAALEPALQAPGVRLGKVTRTGNPNYLFIDLDIAADAAPGEIALRFLDRGQPVLTHRYALRAREAGSAQRASYGNGDAIYLVVPDRFANGDPSNDNVAGLREKADRAHPGGRHGGDLKGLGERLDYIAGMGFTMVWPTPILENDAARYSYHGYGITDLYKVDPRFGSNEEYRALVAAAKTKGIGFLQDIVLNHVGVHHWWMRDLPAPDWLNGTREKHAITNHGHSTVMDPNASKADRDIFTDGWFSDGMPDLNQRQPLLATYLIQNSIWWIEYAGLSGVRTDTFAYSDRGFLAEWSRRLTQEYPKLNMVGEEWTSNPAIVAYWQRGKRNQDGYASHMPGMMDFPLHDAVRAAFASGVATPGADPQQGLVRLYDTLANDFQYADPYNLVVFPGNHDTSRIFAALGEDRDAYRMAIAFYATVRGIPQFFYGDELMMAGPKERDDGVVRADFPGGWAGDAADAVSGRGLAAHQKDAQDFVRRLMTWRRATPVLHRGRMTHFMPDKGTYVYFRHDGAQKVMVAFNRNAAAATLDTARFAELLVPGMQGTDIVSGKPVRIGATMELAPKSVVIVDFR